MTKKHPETQEQQPSNTQEETTANNAPKLEEQIKALTEENAKLKDALIRSHAEMENVKKRHSKELSSAKDFAISEFALETAEIMENIYRALESFPENHESNEVLKNIYEGFTMVQKTLYKAFEKHHIARIFPEDDMFDHHFHQAISHVESPAHKDGQVITVVQAGYKIKSRLLRPAMVVVAKNSNNPN